MSGGQAHLPITLHPAPRKVAMIGLATGITAGAALLHDQVESLTAIELSQLVTEACKKHFGPFNGGIFTDPRAQVVVEDGRTYIASCVDRFDVIVGDLFLPWRPGVGRLYSLEHFQAVRRALRSGGLFCQMLPMYQFNRDQQETVLATLLQVFPEAHLFRLSFNSRMPVLAMVVFREGDLDWSGLKARCDQIRTADKISDIVIRHHEAIAMLRNYYSAGAYGSPAEMLVEKADLLTLTVPEMTVLLGGMRALTQMPGAPVTACSQTGPVP